MMMNFVLNINKTKHYYLFHSTNNRNQQKHGSDTVPNLSKRQFGNGLYSKAINRHMTATRVVFRGTIIEI